ncbi:ABC transporter G family member 14-like, partial [Camellia sinensis]|uniref:ABC transporter G family member 14-like n=1 Tax=Camellia sinensis TaxID=4442 RepID=UPI001035AD01
LHSHEYREKQKFTGIGPVDKHTIEQGHSTEQEQKLVRDVLISAYDKNISPRLKAELCSLEVNNYNYTKDASPRKNVKSEQWCTSWWHQFKVLIMRGLRERRYEAFNKLRIFQVISVAILGGLLWWHTPTSHIEDRIAMLFFFSVFWGFYPLYNAVFTFPQERSMLMKERSSGMYRLSSYFLARTFGDLPLELALPTAFTFIIYWMGGLKPNPVTFILSLLVVLYNVLVAQSLGLAIGAILMDVKQATTLASVTTLVFLIAGGYYIQQIPPFIVWLKYLCDKTSCIHYHPCKANIVADALSRKGTGNMANLLTEQRELLAELDKMSLDLVMYEREAIVAAVMAQPTLIEEIKLCQMEDESLKRICDELETKLIPGFNLMNSQVKAEHQRLAGLLQPLPIPKWKWEHLTMNFVVGLPQTPRDMNSVWVIVDRLTKSAHFLPVKTQYNADKLAVIYVNEIVRLHGVPVP